MEITVVRALYFSGTGTTEKVVCTLAKALGRYLGASVERFDFTRPEAREAEQRFGPGELAVIGTPVYAGRVPNVLLKYLTGKLRGSGALAIPVVLFGNRNFDDGLIELRNILEQDGLRAVAGAAFVGEHSFSRTLAAGRPDKQDLARAEDFARAAAEKIAALSALPETAVAVRGRNRCGPIIRPGPAGQSGEYPEGQAAHRSGQVQRLRIVRSAVPHGQYRSGGCFPGEGYLHQMLCLCEKVSHRGKVLHGPGLSVSPARTGRRLCPPGSGGNVSVIHCNRACGSAAGPVDLPVYFSPIPWFWHKRHLLHP